MIVEVLEDTLNGGYGGLYGEVVTEDSYKMRQLKFVPDVIIDLGANVGVYARFARELFPNAAIVCVEPDPENYEHLKKFTPDENTYFINMAIGRGQVFRCEGAPNGAHESYFTNGVGTPEKQMTEDKRLTKTETRSIMIDLLLSLYVNPGQKSVVKIDIEGNETVIFSDQTSMAMLKRVDYICGEFHNSALTGNLIDSVKAITIKAMNELKETHDVEMDHIYFFATKK